MKALLLAALAALPIGAVHADPIAPTMQAKRATFCSVNEPKRCTDIVFDGKGVTDSSALFKKGGACEGSTYDHETCVARNLDLQEVK